MAKVLKISASGYYSWLNRTVSRRNQENAAIISQIQEIQRKNRFRLGSPRITAQLQGLGIQISKNRVARLIKNAKLGALTSKRHRYPKESDREAAAANLLDRKFTVEKPNLVWVSDITYLPTASGWAYLCTIIDLFNREVIGWSVKKHMETSLIKEAFSKAWKTQKPKQPILLHSDQGSQYTSLELKEYLAKTSPNIIRSMSRKGNCWDNAVAESFFKTLKQELYELSDKVNFKDLDLLLFQYIDGYYNSQRIHSTLGYKTPLEFRQTVAI